MIRVTAVIVPILVLLVVAGARGIAPPRAEHIVATVTLAAVRTDFAPREPGAHRSTALLLWNVRESPRPIGYAFLSCVYLGDGGIFGSGRSYCDGVFTIGSGAQFGKLVVGGVRRSPRIYTLTITGGSGRYAGWTGSLTLRFPHLTIIRERGSG